MPDFRFYLITDRRNSRHDPLKILPGLARAGLRALQVREKDLEPRQLADYCTDLQAALQAALQAGLQAGLQAALQAGLQAALQTATGQDELKGGRAEPGLRMFLNDRSDLALALGLAGVHLREDSLPVARQAPALRESLLFGVSTHNLEGVRAAERGGAAFATFGPVFPTASKAGYGEPVGLEALAEAARASSLPLYALGGVKPDNARLCLEAGAAGVAAISAVWNAPDPLEALEEFRAALGGL